MPTYPRAERGRRSRNIMRADIADRLAISGDARHAIPVGAMDFPAGWEQLPIWQEKTGMKYWI